MGAVAAVLALTFGDAARAREMPQAGNTTSVPDVKAAIPFEKYRLPNGLTVILHVDHSLPLLAVDVWYHVGPSNEPKGRSGFAHLFEHLMFEGSKHAGHEFDRLLESVGATNVNGTTSWDRTDYFESAPRENLELLLWLESDRMGFMVDSLTQERLDVQRDVVKNERRQSYENTPYGASSLALLDALFPEGHPYHGAVIGSMADLSAATLNDVKDFFHAYYAPSNATLTLAGDLDVAQAKALIARYFGTLPDRARPEPKPLPYTPLDKAVRLSVDEQVALTQVAFGYRTPPAFSADDPALELTMALLAGGKATRLYRRLVVEEKLASDVSASLDSNRLAGISTVSAIAASGKSADKLEAGMNAVLEDLAKKGPDARELARAKRRILLEILSSLELLNGPSGDSGRAGLLQRFDEYLKDPGYLTTWLERLERVSAADVQRVTREQLKPEARVVVITRPKLGGAP
jgi:zinc protease